MEDISSLNLVLIQAFMDSAANFTASTMCW